ncbi:MAG: hypothetical protein BWY56_02035 [Acidobacteria bacterium ADurb.Bin340]|nr:MAG: hypothetical protein BWY56_02035 [Acidobacteria bacterium ADurb.Bin340]
MAPAVAGEAEAAVGLGFGGAGVGGPDGPAEGAAGGEAEGFHGVGSAGAQAEAPLAGAQAGAHGALEVGHLVGAEGALPGGPAVAGDGFGGRGRGGAAAPDLPGAQGHAALGAAEEGPFGIQAQGRGAAHGLQGFGPGAAPHHGAVGEGAPFAPDVAVAAGPHGPADQHRRQGPLGFEGGLGAQFALHGSGHPVGFRGGPGQPPTPGHGPQLHPAFQAGHGGALPEGDGAVEGPGSAGAPDLVPPLHPQHPGQPLRGPDHRDGGDLGDQRPPKVRSRQGPPKFRVGHRPPGIPGRGGRQGRRREGFAVEPGPQGAVGPGLEPGGARPQGAVQAVLEGGLRGRGPGFGGAQVGFGPEAAGLLRPGPEPLPVQAPVDQFVAQEAVQVSPAQALQGPQVQHIAHPGRIPPRKAPRGPVEGGIVQVHPHGPGANRPGTEGFGAPPGRLQGRLQPQGRVGIPLEDRRRRS